MPLREGSSGKLIQGTETGQVLTWDQDARDWSAQDPPSGLLPEAATVIGWAPESDETQTLEILPAGHDPGVYRVSLVAVIETGDATGALARTYFMTAPLKGEIGVEITDESQNMKLSTDAGPPVLQLCGASDISFASTGETALTVVVTAFNLAGAPVIDLYASAQRVALLPEE